MGGFLTHHCGRAVFYMVMGFYALPAMETMNEVSEMHNESGAAAAFAMIGIISSLGIAVLYIILFLRKLKTDSTETAHLGSQQAPPPSQVGAGTPGAPPQFA